MAYVAQRGGDGWQMVPCMAVFLSEVEECVRLGLLDVTNLGQIGDARHQAEPTSRHNPALAPNGQWYVCAADFGGRDYAKLAYFHQALYRAHDPRVYDHGFNQRGDGYGLSWPDGGWKWTGRDQGHCHFDVTMRNASLSSNWWVDSLASTAPWGLADFLRGGPVGTTAPTESVEDDMNGQQDAALAEVLEISRNIRDRVLPGSNGRPLRYAVKDGAFVNDPNGKLNRLLDNGDGFTFVMAIRELGRSLGVADDKLDEILAHAEAANAPETPAAS